jgi:hypothetical protein
MMMPARRCTTCADNGQTVWVIPGKQCPLCYALVDEAPSPGPAKDDLWKKKSSALVAATHVENFISPTDDQFLIRNEVLRVDKGGRFGATRRGSAEDHNVSPEKVQIMYVHPF